MLSSQARQRLPFNQNICGVLQHFVTPPFDIMKTERFIEQYGGEFISSRSNGTIIALSKLTEKKHRDEQRLFLSEGVKMAEEAFLHSDVDTVVFSEDAVKEGRDEVLALAEQGAMHGARIIVAGAPAFDKLTTEKSPQGVIAVSRFMSRHARSAETDLSAWHEGRRILMLDHIQDPGNMGTMIRTASAMGYDAVLAAGCADIYSPKTLRASMGAVFRLDILLTDDAVSDIGTLQKDGRRVLAAALGKVSLTLGEAELRSTDCVIIGNEGHGISEELLSACDASLKIPMAEGCESLNAAAAAAMILWEYYRSFGKCNDN